VRRKPYHGQRRFSTRRTVVFTIAAWIVALIIFFPILYTIITSFKSETEAIQPASTSSRPSRSKAMPEVQAQSNYFKFFLNSVVLSLGSTLLALLIAVPAAWSMAFRRPPSGPRTS
jgi:sorbitol/mannitol transport system permease protein